MHRWWEHAEPGGYVFVAIGMDGDGDPAMKVSDGDGGRLWEVDLDLVERVEFVATVKKQGWSLGLECW